MLPPIMLIVVPRAY